eukprot:CAMPEP_0174726102 /NCGR_PEP_ID=MMETSP1094-20130205/47043_1 /TAXON_ID=156173 /ORGANISM="Chrysochromulina brevifilum, Strain UTEX LB 985" /LENGTH=144 /DNA_ID=CAMNT_0015927621 /DNA_START=68 /DNA_END=498 /DNA_ORIENTATION=+
MQATCEAPSRGLPALTVTVPERYPGRVSMPGRTYACRQCNRQYATTDAVRKHVRKAHPEWLTSQGPGRPARYCATVISDDEPLSPATLSPPVPSPSDMGIRTPEEPLDEAPEEEPFDEEPEDGASAEEDAALLFALRCAPAPTP